MKKTIISSAIILAFNYGHAAQYKPEGYDTSIIRTPNPIKQGISNFNRSHELTLYKIEINPFFISNIHNSIENTSEEVDISGETHSIPKSYTKSIELIANEYKIYSYQYLSPLKPVVNAWLSTEIAQLLAKDERISQISEVDSKTALKPSAPYIPIYQDVKTGIDPNSQITSWGVNFIGANTGMPSTLPIYVIDGNSEKIHSSARSDLNIQNIGVVSDPGNLSEYNYHIGHVAGVIGAYDNSKGVRGVNPGQPIRVIATYNAQSTINDGLIPNPNYEYRETVAIALDKAALHAEANNLFSVVNLSMNANPGESTRFAASSENGQGFSRASNRLLIVQSAGNDSQDACNFAYSNKSNTDGILVVGGIKQDGSPFTTADQGITGLPGLSAQGTNAGPCIDVWAPGFNITSLDAIDGLTRVSTGTSFAAPFTAAAASRYGTTSTRPIAREEFIRKNASISNLRVKLNGIQTGISNYIPISKVYKEGTTTDIPQLRNKMFYPVSDFYNFNGNSGSLILETNNSTATITGVAVTLITSSNPATGGNVNFNVYGGASPTAMSLIASNVNIANQTIWGRMHIPVANGKYPFIKISATNPSSWLAYSETEVYGY